MRWERTRFPQLGIIIATLATSLVGCGGQELTSTWRDREVTIDGVDDEWENAMTYVEDKNVAIGLLNDQEYLYICLASIDFQRVHQMIGSGLTVWFDPKGGKKKTFGINFPLEMQFSGEDMSPEKMPMPRESAPDPERLREMVKESAKEMVILGPEKGKSIRMLTHGSEEIAVRLDYSGGKLVYELRVPLIRGPQHPTAIGAGASEIIGVGFETAEFDREMMRNRMREKMGGGMPPGGQGMPPGGMRGGGMRGGRMPGGQRPERLEYWAKVQLASG
ncbi:MAG: hypothetical protein AMJ92_05465 [candidate division Zixibacteria bacterium SM23_81]|nr:MAG: hypothetical protein AMJ92_05465 [candidate division Zixibacteria bacterium SM23_81]